MSALKKVFSVLGWIFVGIVGFSLLMVILSVAALIGSSAIEQDSFAIESEHAVGIAEITGEIMTSRKFEKDLRKLVKNEKIKAIVVRIDSPGGAVGASEELFAAIKRARETKPVVCSLGSIAASGGLYAAVGCDKIVTNRGTLTGSIGVVLMMPNVSSIMKKYGVGMTVIKSGKFKDAGSPFREVAPEDKKQLQGIVDGAHEQFVNIVAESRGLETDAVRKFADGRILLGENAVSLGLADQIGGVAEAARLALQQTGDDAEPEIIFPRKKKSFFEMLGDIGESRLAGWLGIDDGSAKLLYLSFL